MNPLKSLGGVSVSPSPSKYTIAMQDVSAPGAGRTMDAKMHKKTVAKKIRIDLEWKALTFAQAQKILQASSSEYFNAEILDIDGKFITKEFYRGDVNGEFYGEPLNRWIPLTFAIIER